MASQAPGQLPPAKEHDGEIQGNNVNKQEHARQLATGDSARRDTVSLILYLLYINPIGFPAEITENIVEAMRIMEEEQEEDGGVKEHPQPPPLKEPVLPITVQGADLVCTIGTGMDTVTPPRQ